MVVVMVVVVGDVSKGRAFGGDKCGLVERSVVEGT